jgi:hypothetical protein
VFAADIRYPFAALGLVQRPQNLFLAAALFAIRVSSLFLSEDHRKANFSTYPWLTFGFWVTEAALRVPYPALF